MLGIFCTPPLLSGPVSLLTLFLTGALSAGRVKDAHRRAWARANHKEQDRLRVPRGPAVLFSFI